MLKVALAPGYHTKTIEVDGIQRRFRLYIPRKVKKDPQTGRLWFVLACDGVLKGGESVQRMSQFGIDQVADVCGFIVVYLEPLPRQVRWWIPQRWYTIWGWNTRGGMLPYIDGYDDVHFVEAVVEYIHDKIGIGHWCGAGFSAGAQFLHIVAGRCPELLDAIVAVGGTVLGTEPDLASGIHVIIFHGDGDVRVPRNGGLSRHRILWYFTIRTVTTLLAIGLQARRSDPRRQYLGYGAVNKMDAEAAKFEKFRASVNAQRRMMSNGIVKLVEFLLSRELRSHEWHRGGSFNIAEIFASELGLDSLEEI